MSDDLLDTCIVIDFLRGKKEAVEFMRTLTAKASVSTITLTEIFGGLRSQKEEAVARGFFRECKIVGISETIAEGAGNALRHYQASHGLDVPDALIAATAEQHGLALATLNVKHFPMFKGLKAAY